MPLIIPPAGLSAAGFFVPQTFADPTKPPGILADAIDPFTGEYLSIDKGMDPVDSQVLVALTIKRASGSAVVEDGHQFEENAKVDDTTANRIETEIRRSLRRLVDQGDIVISKLTPEVDPDGDMGAAQVEFQNLRARRPDARMLKVLP